MNIQGFKVNFLGDSITEGGGVENMACRYDNRLAKMWELTANNYGIGGTRLAHQTVSSANPRQDLCFCGRAYNMDPTADMVIVYGGVNDYLHGDAPFGEIGDTTPATFCGGVYYLMRYLRENYGDKPVVFVTPARCWYNRQIDYRVPSTRAEKRPGAKPLLAYVEIIQKTAEQFGIPVLDLYHTLPIDPHDPTHYEAYTTDGLHFNDAGHEILALCIKNFIDSLT